MVVGHFHRARARWRPPKADPVLRVDPDAVLAGPVTPERFQSITRRDSQVLEARRRIELVQLTPNDRPHRYRTGAASGLGVPPIEQIGGRGIGEGLNHGPLLAPHDPAI